jgi:hypothetical protein
MRSRNRCLLVIVFLLAVTSLTVRTTAARIIEPLPIPEAIDPGDPDDNTGPCKYKHTGSGILSSGGLSAIAVRPTGSGTPRPPGSDTRESQPARVLPVQGGDWSLGRFLLLLMFRLSLGR